MPTNLTPKTIAHLTSNERPYYVSDALASGLQLRVAPDGDKSWSLRYRIGRRQRRLTLGSFRVLSLADARKAARVALKQVAAGRDPAEQKQERREADTVGEFAKTYIEKHAKLRKRTWKIDKMRLDIDVLPAWEHRLMREITRRDVRELLDSIAARPAPIVANRVRSLLHKLFNFAIKLDVISQNPVGGTERLSSVFCRFLFTIHTR
jgi:hypothetical protein